MSVVYFLILVGVLVTVHELGHFVAARATGVRVLRLSLGFGPALISVRRRGTEYRVGAVPLGGYVRLLGEDPTDEVPEAERAGSFAEKPLWQRLVVVFAGPAFNLLAPLPIYFFFYLGHTEVPAPVIGDVLPASPAASAGLEPGDEVVSVDGHGVRTWEDVESRVGGRADKSVRFVVKRGSESVSTYVTPRRHTLRQRDGMKREQTLVGITQAPLPPRVGVLDAASPAARAGLETGDLVISVEGQAVGSWTALLRELDAHTRHARIAYLRPEPAGLGFADVAIEHAALADVVPDFHVGPSGRAEVDSGLISAEFFVARVEPGTPAARAGLVPGDVITALDGAPVTSWLAFDQALMAEPDRAHHLEWRRARAGGGSDAYSADVVQMRQKGKDEYGHERELLVFGAQNDFRAGDGQMVPIDGRVLYAAGHAWGRTGETIREVGRGFGTLLTGRAPAGSMGGPIMMYRIASVTGHKGWDYFLLMIALISVNLGLLNLLPIPVLDGGYLVMFAVEGLARRQLSPRARDAVLTAGLVIIVAITALALRNDIARYLL
jgi:regulator of sigma E protease